MKFLIDAQLPRSLARQLSVAGHDAVHTLDLPLGNRTPDEDIQTVAISQGRIVVTKDSDFVNAFILRGPPPKLLLVSTGNSSNEFLLSLFAANLPGLVSAFAMHDFVELGNTAITIHA